MPRPVGECPRKPLRRSHVEYEETANSAVYFCLMQEVFQWALSLLGICKRQEMFSLIPAVA
jgi:hypothetical protein